MVLYMSDKISADTKSLREYLVSVDRVTKVVKGGRILNFSATVVVGDGDGLVGFAKGRAKEVSVAVQKAVEKAKKSMIKVNIVSGTLPKKATVKYGSSTLYVIPCTSGVGLVSGGAARVVFSAAGVKNIFSKIRGSRNPKNVVRATFKALSSM